MKLTAFLADKCLLLLLHLICLALLSAFLHITGYPAANITLICIFWLLILTVWLFLTFRGRRNYYKEAFHILENTDKPWLLGEMLPDSFFLEDKLHREMLCRSNRAALEKIRLSEDTQREYREYLESWVHEIKAPISTIALLCENGKTADIPNAQQTQVPAPNMHNFLQTQELRSSEDISLDRITSVTNRVFRDIRLENRKIENYVDMVLYHARSEEVYKDYLIKETDLQEMIYEALEKERLLFIKSHVRAEVSCHETVYTDKKWCVFILSQLILNSIKYRAEMPLLRFYTSRGNNQITLTKTCPVFLKRDLPAATDAVRKKLPAWGYICAKSSAANWESLFPHSQNAGREPGCFSRFLSAVTSRKYPRRPRHLCDWLRLSLYPHSFLQYFRPIL